MPSPPQLDAQPVLPVHRDVRSVDRWAACETQPAPVEALREVTPS